MRPPLLAWHRTLRSLRRNNDNEAQRTDRHATQASQISRIGLWPPGRRPSRLARPPCCASSSSRLYATLGAALVANTIRLRTPFGWTGDPWPFGTSVSDAQGGACYDDPGICRSVARNRSFALAKACFRLAEGGWK